MRDTQLNRITGLIEPHPDPDGYYSGRVATPEQSKLLVLISCWAILTGIFGVVRGWRVMGASIALAGFVSMMYWFDPTFSWRRSLDITVVQAMLWSHLYLAWSSPIFWPYAAIQAVGISCYLGSWWFFKHGESWVSTFLHTALHVFANLSIGLLYAMG